MLGNCFFFPDESSKLRTFQGDVSDGPVFRFCGTHRDKIIHSIPPLHVTMRRNLQKQEVLRGDTKHVLAISIVKFFNFHMKH